ncbi:hypothetical protein [Hydrogenophaga defluvii]|uniref:PsiF repeat-containing protein n=1 Tax=Hydrogenophaga defluvii TaxID=249410 RepID=A0ABW2SGE2_9BURK
MKHATELAWLLGLALLVSTAQARQVKAEDKPRQRTGSVKVVPSSSEESDATRAKRLKRECRGRPNAGACLGHAS